MGRGKRRLAVMSVVLAVATAAGACGERERENERDPAAAPEMRIRVKGKVVNDDLREPVKQKAREVRLGAQSKQAVKP